MPTVWTIREQLKRGNIRLVGGSSNLACPGKAGSAVAGAADQAERGGAARAVRRSSARVRLGAR